MKQSVSERHITFAWNYTNWGGAQIYLIAVMKLLPAQWTYSVLLPADSPADLVKFLENVGARLEFFSPSLDHTEARTFIAKVSRQLRRVRSEAAMLRRLVRRDLPNEIAHLEIAPWQSWLLLAALSAMRANVFLTLNNFLTDVPRWRAAIWRLRLQIVSRLPGIHFIASNEDTKTRLRGWVTDKFWQTIIVAHSCIDPGQIESLRLAGSERDNLRAQYDVGASETLVLTVGQFVDRKGRWILLDAARRVVDEDPNFRFIWLAPALPDSKDQQRIAAYGLGDDFRIVRSDALGPERTDVLRFFNVADIFALPSFVEGLPIAILEAMALGIPVVSTNVYAIPEAVRQTVTGIIVEPGDADALADALLELSKDADLRQRLGEAGRRLAVNEFDEKISAQKFFAAYRRCFANE